MPVRMTSQQTMAMELARGRRDAEPNRQRERIENLMLRMPIGVVVVDRRYDIQTINNAARRLFGVHGPAIGEDFIHLAQGMASQPLRAAIDAALRAPAVLAEPVLFDISTPDGEALHLRVLCYPEIDDERQTAHPESGRRAGVRRHCRHGTPEWPSRSRSSIWKSSSCLP